MDFGKTVGALAILFGLGLVAVMVSWQAQPPEFEGERTSIDVTEENFQEVVLENDKVVLVDFYGPHCPPCRAMDPRVESIAEEYEGRAVVARINTNISHQLSQQFGIHSIPTLMVFYQGEVKDRMIGLQPAERLIGAISPFLPEQVATSANTDANSGADSEANGEVAKDAATNDGAEDADGSTNSSDAD